MSGPVCAICWIVVSNSFRYASQSIIMTTSPGLPRVDGQSGASAFENTAAVRQRQLAEAEAGEREHGVRDRRSHRRDARLADASRWSGALRDVHGDPVGRLRDARQSVIVGTLLHG